ncbi:MAG: trehalase family glycosidase [Aggregatilineales bacterium]
MDMLSFNLREVPFSRYGSYIAFSWTDGLLMRTIRGGLDSTSTLLTLALVNDDHYPVLFDVKATPSHLHLHCEDGFVELVISDSNRVLVRGRGVRLKLSRETGTRQFDNALSPDGTRWEINAYDSLSKIGLRAVTGKLEVDAVWNRVRSDSIVATFTPNQERYFEGEIQVFDSVWLPEDDVRPFDEEILKVQQHYETWVQSTLAVHERWNTARELAAYIMWSCVVEPRGYHQRPAMLMSKNWMNKIWSWDNCFNALALTTQNPALAWDQFVTFFDHQDAQGAIPDHLTDSTRSFRFYKPPIHGWALLKLMQYRDVVDSEKLSQIYKPLCRWTDWWLTYRDDDHDGIPQYNHGNESGWDNGTVFGEGVPVESPDLSAYLVIQMDTLSEIATYLGKQDEAEKWSQRADALCTLLIEHFWNGSQFVARHANSHQIISGDSTLVFMPLILGKRLPEDMRQKLIENLKRFITANGIATEQPDSPYYEADGYWRGPIWAPSTYLLVDGLLVCGEYDLAIEISRRFCEMAARSGMAENYDALSGDGLRDRAYTWTSSVFLLLGNLVLHANQPEPSS